MKIKYDRDVFSDRGLKWLIVDGNHPTSLEAIQIANDIIEEYDAQDYTLILRQLYYQFVSRGLTVENTLQAYKNLGNLMTKARNNGLISWYGINDDGRGVNGIYLHEEDDHTAVNGLEGLLSLDFWKRQYTYVEVWVEKQSLIHVVAKACNPLKCPHLATKGYLSASEAWRAGRRFREQREAGKNVVMIHLGDHDPEGLDMTRDNQERLNKYSEGLVEVRRIGLNMDQVLQYNPPPNYAKPTSSRFEGYVDQFGEECWELDALEPRVIVDLIKNEVEQFIDRDIWNDVNEEQTKKRYYLEKVWDHWDDLKSHIDYLEDV